MCFSATASFTASATLLLISCVTIYRTGLSNKKIMFAAIPLLFSLQQACEGLLWQALTYNQPTMMTVYAYLFFVFVIWPLWMPISIMKMNNGANKMFFIPITAGLVVALASIALSFNAAPIPSILQHHIYYSFDLPQSYFMVGTLFYLTAVITPFFISNVPYMMVMGILLAASYVLSYVIYYQFILSLWCFFAAILSILVARIVW